MPNIIINNTCNQQCSYCFAEDSMGEEKLSIKNQSLGTYIRILSFLKKAGHDDVRLLGGEPLLHPQISKMVQIANKGGFYTRIFSNLNFPPEYVQRHFSKINTAPHTINANINNRDFYTDGEYERVLENLVFFRDKGVGMTIGYNIYDMRKSFDDIVAVARTTGIFDINLKITNTILGKPLIVDTGSRAYGEYIYRIIEKYIGEFRFEFSCGLSKDIFLREEIDFMNKHGIFPKYGCEGFSGKFDIDIDGSIYKCFPTRALYLDKNISVDTISDSSVNARFTEVIRKSDGVCAAHL